MSFRTVLALLFTFIYMCGFLFIAIYRQDELASLSLNELGDFLAGAFGPLALAWLVFGYFQQGEELRQGTEALLLQAQELKESVRQQTEMAEATKLSLRNNEKALEPILQLVFKSSHPVMTRQGFVDRDEFVLSNLGACCENLVIRVSLNGDEVSVVGCPGLASAETFGFEIDDTFIDNIYYDFDISYLKLNGTSGWQQFEVCRDCIAGDSSLVAEKKYL
ncbi:hypothetical protein P5705_17980 [Pseudomonas entomophila]|uniref:hypothetical protein n=1 Tax=Pseudomonas entomophila TaxID=312306 RepID=UPI002406C342|nr:hypothetical protein [Pseudomonas entomophila]MDF9619539.1 hypothetical protein [Pseudomonas entomophila]